MKKLIILSLVFASCTRSLDVAPPNNGKPYNVTLTGVRVNQAGNQFSLKLDVNVQRADSATKIEIARADYAYIYNLSPINEGDQYMNDFQINQNATQTSYVIKSTLLGGQVRTSQVFTISH